MSSQAYDHSTEVIVHTQKTKYIMLTEWSDDKGQSYLMDWHKKGIASR